MPLFIFIILILINFSYPKFIFAFSLAEPQIQEKLYQEQLRQTEYDQRLREQQENIYDQKPQYFNKDSSKLIRNETPCFIINEIIIDNGYEQNVKMLKKTLKAADQPDTALKSCLGIKAINQVINRIQSALIEMGYITSRVQLSPYQNVLHNQLNIIITPGRIYHLQIQSQKKHNVATWNIVPIRFSNLLNLRYIEQLLENLKQLPSVQAKVIIIPSSNNHAKAGDSDILINWQQSTPWRLTLNLDDNGRQAIGRYQADITLAYDNPLNLNDLFYISLKRDLNYHFSSLKHRSGITGHVLHYQLPLGYAWLKLTTRSNHWSQAVPTQYNQYRYEGLLRETQIQLFHLLHRGQAYKTNIYGSLTWRQTYQLINQVKLDHSYRNTLMWELGLHHRYYFKETTIDSCISYHQNHNRQQIPSRISKAQLTLNFPFSFILNLKRQYGNYYASLQTQWANQTLNPEDQFTIGGKYSVRGFDGELNLAGEQGWLLRQELSIKLGQLPLNLFLGIDHGQTAGPNTQYQIGKQLTSAALGLRGALNPINWEIFAGVPLKKPTGFSSSRLTTGFALSAMF